jgi:hypothetical protein
MWVRVVRLDWGRTDRNAQSRHERRATRLQPQCHSFIARRHQLSDHHALCLELLLARETQAAPPYCRRHPVSTSLTSQKSRETLHLSCLWCVSHALESPFSACLSRYHHKCLSRDAVSMSLLCNLADISFSADDAYTQLIVHAAQTLSQPRAVNTHSYQCKLAGSR